MSNRINFGSFRFNNYLLQLLRNKVFLSSYNRKYAVSYQLSFSLITSNFSCCTVTKLTVSIRPNHFVSVLCTFHFHTPYHTTAHLDMYVIFVALTF